MSDNFRLKDKYILARCCSPSPLEPIVGYYSHDMYLKVHRPDCINLARVASERLVALEWADILAEPPSEPGRDFSELDDIDFAVLRFHKEFGIDYSLKVARMLSIKRQVVFDRHKKLRELQLLERVEPRIVQYRKGVVNNKWIKHRNHTYYQLTDKGRDYLEHRSEDPE